MRCWFWVNGFLTLYWELTNTGRVVWLCHWLHRWERRSCRVFLEAEEKTKCHDQPWSYPSGFALHPKDHSISTQLTAILALVISVWFIYCVLHVQCMCTCGKLYVEVKGEHWVIPQLVSNLFFMTGSLTNLKLSCSTRLTSLKDHSGFASAGIMRAHHNGRLFMQVQRISDA